MLRALRARGISANGDGGTDDAAAPQQAAGDAPAPQQAPNISDGARACVVSELIPKTRSGPINRGGNAGERIGVEITWRDDIAPPPGVGASYCACRCGEYRQYVKGHLIINGRPETEHVWGGAVIEEDVYHEDGLERDPAPRYGHRDEPLRMDEDFLPTRASGCTYVGRDFPRVMIGDQIDMVKKFKGQSFDACNNVSGPINEWEVRFVGKLNYGP
jgi:hypothetical protein